MNKKYKTIDLFAGIGGIRKGFEITNKFENIFSVEKDKFACQTYEHLYHEIPYPDITDNQCHQIIKGLDYDVLLAGFPCQAFSIAGLKKGFLDSQRGTLFFEATQIIDETQPKAFLLENVVGLITHNHGQTFKTILQTLDALNYTLVGIHKENNNFIFNKKDIIRNPYNFGIPQKRSRVFLVGFRKDILDNNIQLDKIPETNNKIIYQDINELLDVNPDIKYFLTQKYVDTLKKHKQRHLSKNNGFGYCVVNDKPNNLANTIMATGGSGKERNIIRQKIKDYDVNIFPQKGKLNNEYLRHMTPNEWAKLQGFVNYAFIDKKGNDNFSFPKNISVTQQYKLLGNSVCIPIIETIAKYIYKVLRKIEK